MIASPRFAGGVFECLKYSTFFPELKVVTALLKLSPSKKVAVVGVRLVIDVNTICLEYTPDARSFPDFTPKSIFILFRTGVALLVFSISEGELDFGIGLKTVVGEDPNRNPQVFSEKADSRMVEEIESIFEVTLESE